MSRRFTAQVMSSCLCKKPEGAIFPLWVVAIEDGIDDSIYTLTGPYTFFMLDKQQAMLYSSPMKCPHCGKKISDSMVAAEAGRLGGKKTAKRGPEYFREIAAKRKSFKGGRPKKETT
ncbi:MAG: hypothetical protein HYX72_02615 [Acidobacteria bacterium]|nr:hypothetical protein [Acidobacteriota bacterium]